MIIVIIIFVAPTVVVPISVPIVVAIIVPIVVVPVVIISVPSIMVVIIPSVILLLVLVVHTWSTMLPITWVVMAGGVSPSVIPPSPWWAVIPLALPVESTMAVPLFTLDVAPLIIVHAPATSSCPPVSTGLLVSRLVGRAPKGS